jgi:hypothetical protein
MAADDRGIPETTEAAQGAQSMMKRTKRGRRRRLATLFFLAAVAFSPVPARAQAPAPEETGTEDKSGRPVDGYILTSIFAFGALFAVAKSARR